MQWDWKCGMNRIRKGTRFAMSAAARHLPFPRFAHSLTLPFVATITTTTTTTAATAATTVVTELWCHCAEQRQFVIVQCLGVADFVGIGFVASSSFGSKNRFVTHAAADTATATATAHAIIVVFFLIAVVRRNDRWAAAAALCKLHDGVVPICVCRSIASDSKL
jgi:hypothetical protein